MPIGETEYGAMSTGKTEITQCDRRLGSSQFRGGTDTRSGGNEATQRKPMCSAAISAVWEAGLCPGRGRYGNCRTGYTATGGRGLDHSVVGAGSEVRVVLGSACPAASWTSRRLARASRLSVFLQPNRAGGVLTKERAFADVAAKHRGSLVARLLGDDALGDPGSSSRGCKAGPQRVSGHLAGVKPGSGGVALQHERHCLGAESCCPHVAMAVHGAKGCSLDDARDLEHPE